MSEQMIGATANTNLHGLRAGAVRVLANALLVLLAYEVVSMGAVAIQMALTGWIPPETPVEGVPFVLYAAFFLLVRWIYVLPGLLAVLVGIEYVARRTAHARVLTAVVAFAPMVLWELTQEQAHLSPFGVLLGVTAVLFAALARLPGRRPASSRDDGEAAQPADEAAVAHR